jgi:hypothetical protein
MKKMKLKEVAEVVNNEGLGYAVQHYLDSAQIEDPELAKQWGKARAALDIIEMTLQDYLE